MKCAIQHIEMEGMRIADERKMEDMRARSKQQAPGC
jgi:hypothetical protein